MRRLLIAVLLSTPLFAQSPEEWDVERRLADRFDEAKNAERIAAAKEKSPNFVLGSATDPPGARHYLIVGWRNPELYLPHELFDSLMDRDGWKRDAYGKKFGDFGWEAASFWSTFDQLAADYRAVRYKRRTPTGATASCRARFEALERARETFGRKKFDAFLYSAVPPGTVSTITTSQPDPAASLRQEARGCPTDPNDRPAWEWTIDQRLAARNVAADRKRRVDQLLATEARAKSPRPYDHLLGRIRPELLLPTEVVEVLIDVLAAGDERTARARADAVEQAADLDLPPEFFATVEKAFAGAIAARREQARMARKYPAGTVISGEVAARLNGLIQDDCRGRWKGIQTLRAAYGKAFDRFLYEIIAPNVRKTYLVPVTTDTLRDQARGCP